MYLESSKTHGSVAVWVLYDATPLNPWLSKMFNLNNFINLIVCVLVDNSWLKSMNEGIHQPLTFPQPLSSLCPIWAYVPAETALLEAQELISSQWLLSVPQTPRGVLEDRGPLCTLQFGGVGRVSPPARVWNDDFVRQCLKPVVDDYHLQWLVWREIPQSTCRW